MDRKEMYHLLTQEKRLSNDQTLIIAKYLQNNKDDLEIYGKFLEKNDGLVRKCLAMTIPIEKQTDDLLQEGRIGLMKAVDRFDHSKDNAFSTYAIWWIRQSIKRSYDNTKSIIRLPVHVLDKQNKANKCITTYYNQHGELPSSDYIAKETGLSLREVRDIRQSTYEFGKILSLTTPLTVDEGNDSTLENIIADSTNIEADVLNEACSSTLLKEAKKILTDREYTVLVKRLGLENGIRMTLEQVGDEIGVTRERIRQIENNALKKLQRNRTVREYYAAAVS